MLGAALTGGGGLGAIDECSSWQLWQQAAYSGVNGCALHCVYVWKGVAALS